MSLFRPKRRQTLFESRFTTQIAAVDPTNRRRRWQWLLLLIILGVLAWYFLFSSYWVVREVKVEGNKRLTVESIQGMVPAVGKNIFRYNTTVAHDVIAQQPEVAGVSITRRLPHTIGVVVVEREPILIWQTTNNLYEVDNTGEVFRPRDAAEDRGNLYIVSDTANVHVDLGGKVVPLHFIDSYRKLVKTLPDLYPELIDHFEIGETVYDLDVVMKDGRRVRFNILSDVNSQLQDLKKIAEKRNDLFTRSVIDLRVDRWAYIR